jgi:hypothetical protein
MSTTISSHENTTDGVEIIANKIREEGFEEIIWVNLR